MIHTKKIIGIALIIVLIMPVRALAQTPSSSSYQVPESAFSSGGDDGATSASYSAQGAAGILGVGEGNSTSYTAFPGFITPNEEFLELNVQSTSVNLGNLDTGTTGSGTATFYVRSYINGSFVVYTRSTSPTSEGGAVLDPIAAAAASSAGTEQFGINLVANATPGIGTDPVPDPSTAFANGEAASGYDTADNFQYVNGEAIAQSGSTGPAWGQTNYTISYIANISSITEAGTYTMNHDLVLTSTY